MNEHCVDCRWFVDLGRAFYCTHPPIDMMFQNPCPFIDEPEIPFIEGKETDVPLGMK